MNSTSIENQQGITLIGTHGNKVYNLHFVAVTGYVSPVGAPVHHERGAKTGLEEGQLWTGCEKPFPHPAPAQPSKPAPIARKGHVFGGD